MIAALPPDGGLWEAERYPADREAHRILSMWRVGVLFVGFGATAAVGGWAWDNFQPEARVQLRIVADGPGAAARALLAESALRLGDRPNRTATLDSGGDALVISATAEDTAAAWMIARSATDIILSTVRPAPMPADPAPSERPRAERPPSPRTAPMAERARLLAAADAVDARIAAVSAGLTAITRDLAATARISADRKAGRETLDKGAAALADLQLQRLQLLSKYQDDYPAVLVLDGQIRSMKAFLQDESRRVDAATRADPAEPILSAERDRLRAELAQLTDRKTSLAAELATSMRVAAVPVADATPAPPPARFVPPAPVLMEAETTATRLADPRWTILPITGAAGLLLTVLAWFKPRRRAGLLQVEHLVTRLEHVIAALPPPQRMRLQHEGYAALAQPSRAGAFLDRNALHELS